MRYGLPADYFICAVTAEPKQGKRVLSALQTYFHPFTPNIDNSSARLVGRSAKQGKKKAKSNGSSAIDENALVGEFQSLMEEEYFEFVLQELPVYTKG